LDIEEENTMLIAMHSMKKETIRIIKTLIAVHNEILERSFFVSDMVSPTKIGTVPIGFNTENSAAKR
jgi:hypothetical protein